MKEVVIIGSGLGGLASGLLLAKRHYSVTILERSTQPGGCLQSYRRGSQLFDTGLHYVGGLAPGEPLHEPFRELGLLDLPWVRMDDDFDHIMIGDSCYAMYQGYENFVQNLAKQFPHQQEQLKAFVERLQNVTPDDMDVNAWELLHDIFTDERLIQVVSGAAMKLELRKESLPFFSFAHTLSSFIQSSWRLKGDGNMIVNRLIEQIEELGGRVVCNANVAKVIPAAESDDSPVRVITDGDECYQGDIVIADIHPLSLARMVPQDVLRHRQWVKRLSRLQNTAGMFTVSLVVEPETIEYLNHNIYVYDTDDIWELHNANNPVKGVMISFGPTIDLLTPMSWEECQPWHETSRPMRRGDEYDRMCSQKAQQCIELAEKALPALHRHIKKIHTSTPLTYRDYLASPQGTAFGIRKDCRMSLMTYLSPRTPLSNVFLTGQSVMLQGIEGVTMSACQVVEEAVKSEK